MTYAELTSAVAAWVNDPQVEPSIPTFIALAEAQINRRLAAAGVAGAVVRARCVIDAEYSQMPDDLARPLSLVLADGKVIEIISQESFDALVDRGARAPAAPVHVTMVGGEMRFHPVPNRAYTVELAYQARPAALSQTNGANWVLTQHPDVYLYGALLQSAPFLGDDGRLPVWGQLYTTALDSLIEAEDARRGARGTPAFRPNIPHRCEGFR